jgi:hypothetical protein
MKFADHTKLDRKSGEAEGSAVPRTFLGNVFDRAYPDFLLRCRRQGRVCGFP